MTVVSGINYPWSSFQGRSNYGCDFGVHVWGSHSGVSANVEAVSRDFDAMSSAGFEVARWFVFTDGRAGIRFDADGRASGLGHRFTDDMDAALEIAGARGMALCLVLFDFLWMKGAPLEGTSYAPNPEALASPEGQARLFGNVIDPFLDRYGASTALHSIDVINEPDWVTEGLEFRERRWRRRRGSTRPFSKADLRSLVSGVASRVHARSHAVVTVGGGRVRHAPEWNDEAYDLDVIQVHSYPDVEHPDRDRSLIGCSSADLGVSKPVLIGEFPVNGDREHPPDHHPPALSADDYFAVAKDGRYFGAWPWSFKGHDPFGGWPRLTSAPSADAARRTS